MWKYKKEILKIVEEETSPTSCQRVLIKDKVECPGDPGHFEISYINCSGVLVSQTVPLAIQTICIQAGTFSSITVTCGSASFIISGECTV